MNSNSVTLTVKIITVVKLTEILLASHSQPNAYLDKWSN